MSILYIDNRSKIVTNERISDYLFKYYIRTGVFYYNLISYIGEV